MILKSLIELTSRKTLRTGGTKKNINPDRKGIQSIAYLIDLALPVALKDFDRLHTAIGLPFSAVSVLGYLPVSGNKNQYNFPVFSAKDLSWFGRFKKPYVSQFINQEVDLLINYFNTEQLPLHLVAGKANSRLKVGLQGPADHLNDIMLHINAKETDVFIDELLRYLRILKEIK